MGRRGAIPEIRSPREGGGEGSVTFHTETRLVNGLGTLNEAQLPWKGQKFLGSVVFQLNPQPVVRQRVSCRHGGGERQERGCSVCEHWRTFLKPPFLRPKPASSL